MNEIVEIANSPVIWVCSSIVVLVVAVQAWLYYRLALKHAPDMGMSKEDCGLAIRTGVISCLGPAVACFVALVGLMAIIGGPIAWQRLSVIGAAPTELAVATAATKALGLESAQLTTPGFTMQALSVTWWTLALNGCGWLIVCALFADKLEAIREKVGGGDIKWLGVLSSAAMIGIFAYLTLSACVANLHVRLPQLGAAIASGVCMFICLKLAGKYPRLREYSLGIAIIIGLIAGSIMM